MARAGDCEGVGGTLRVCVGEGESGSLGEKWYEGPFAISGVPSNRPGTTDVPSAERFSTKCIFKRNRDR
jgi:hypothetical protein